MDSVSVSLLQQLIPMGGRSLLQYVSESCPWVTPQTQNELSHIMTLAQEERDAVTKVIAFLQKRHVRPVVLGSYPAPYTMMNFITIDFLMPRLIADHQKQIAHLESMVSRAAAEEIRGILQLFLEMKRRHLHTLQETSQARQPVPS